MPIHEGHEHSSTQNWSYDSKEAECKKQGDGDEGDQNPPVPKARSNQGPPSYEEVGKGDCRADTC